MENIINNWLVGLFTSCGAMRHQDTWQLPHITSATNVHQLAWYETITQYCSFPVCKIRILLCGCILEFIMNSIHYVIYIVIVVTDNMHTILAYMDLVGKWYFLWQCLQCYFAIYVLLTNIYRCFVIYWQSCLMMCILRDTRYMNFTIKWYTHFFNTQQTVRQSLRQVHKLNYLWTPFMNTYFKGVFTATLRNVFT